MSAQEKYQSLLELANQNGTTYELSEGDKVYLDTPSRPARASRRPVGGEPVIGPGGRSRRHPLRPTPKEVAQ